MKKLFPIVLAALLSAPVFAQQSTTCAPSSSDHHILSVGGLSHWGWGYSFVQSNEFKPAGSGEFFLNVLDVKFYPVKEFGVDLGLDCKWSYIGTKENMFRQNSEHIVDSAVPFSTLGKTLKNSRSQISIFSLSVPVLAKVVIDRFRIGGGAEANFNLVGDTFYRYRADGERTREREKKLALNKFSYNFVGLVGIGNLTVFGKYYPKNSRMLPEGSVDFNYWTLGVAYAL